MEEAHSGTHMYTYVHICTHMSHHHTHMSHHHRRDAWKRRIVTEAGEHFKGKGGDHLGTYSRPKLAASMRNLTLTLNL